MTKRDLIGAGGIATVLATIFFATPGHAQTCPDTMLNGQTQNLSAEAIASRPVRISIPAGGNLDLRECADMRAVGFVTERPDLSLRLTSNPNRRRIDFRVESECDAVMLVNSPSGRWFFDDDSNRNSPLDPALSFNRARPGWWDVWLGNYEEPDACRATLVVSAGPPGSRPASAQSSGPGYQRTGYRK